MEIKLTAKELQEAVRIYAEGKAGCRLDPFNSIVEVAVTHNQDGTGYVDGAVVTVCN